MLLVVVTLVVLIVEVLSIGLFLDRRIVVVGFADTGPGPPVEVVDSDVTFIGWTSGKLGGRAG